MTLSPIIIGINWPLHRAVIAPHRLGGSAGGSSDSLPSDGPPLSFKPANRNEPAQLDYLGFCPDCDCAFVHVRERK